MSKDLLIQKLILLWNRYPELRFGQLIENIIGNHNYLWFLSDPEFEKRIDIIYEHGFKALREETEIMIQEYLNDDTK